MSSEFKGDSATKIIHILLPFIAYSTIISAKRKVSLTPHMYRQIAKNSVRFQIRESNPALLGALQLKASDR